MKGDSTMIDNSENMPVVEVTTEDENTSKKKLMDDFNIDSFQKYVLGYKKNGMPRAVYDVFKDYQKIKKKKKKKDRSSKDDEYIMYFPSLLNTKKKKKHKKKKKK